MKKIGLFALGAVLLGAVFAGGAYFGYEQRPSVEKIIGVFNKDIPVELSEDVNFSPFWEAWSILEEKYVSPNGISRQDMVWGAVEGLAASLGDPYTVFFAPKENELFKSDIRGDFEGVGMEIGIRDNILTVVAPLKGTPAFRAGIKAGDKIIEIDEESTAGITVEEAVRKIRGEKGTEVVLTISRKSEKNPLEILVIRDKIDIPVLETEKREDGIFIIKLFNFSGKEPFEFRRALEEFALSGGNKLVLDLRNNPGGFLEAAVDTVSWFLPSGKVIVTEDFGEEKRVHRSRGYDVFGENLNMVVLVNEGSASASEIVAGALQEYGIAKIVGTKTFGKGSVQELLDVTPETSLKVTVARWVTPDGKSISDHGIDPDVVVEPSDEDSEELDIQMEKAVEILINQ